MSRRLLVLLLGAAGLGVWWLDMPARLGWTRRADAPLLLYGNVDVRQVQLGFRVNGRVAELAVEEGDRVAAGTLLARLDSRPYEDGLQAAQAQAAARAATLAKLRASPREAEIAQAQARHAERLAGLENAERAFERARQLRGRGTAPQAVLDDAQAARNMAVAAVASAGEGLRLLEEGTRAEDLAVARADLDAAEANRSAARAALEDAQLRAPGGGIIRSRVREPGAIAAPGDAVYVLSLTEPVWVRAYVPEPLLGRIRPGMEVEVLSDSAPDRPYRGRIGFVSPVAEFTPKSVETPELRTDLVYRLRVIVMQAGDGLRQGMPVTVRLPSGPQAS